MARELDQNEILAYKQQRTLMELTLANELCNLFQRPGLLNPIRDMTYRLTEQLVALAEHYQVGLNLIARDQPVRLWHRLNLVPGDMRGALASRANWSPEDCSDLIRIFAAVVEEDALQGWFADATALKGTRDPLAFAPGFRARSRLPADARSAAHEEVRGFLRPGTASVTGISTAMLLETSIVGAVDRMFNLPEGADISGTTADSIYSLRLAHAFWHSSWEQLGIQEYRYSLLPVLQLLPLATMVAQYHHTILECALTLTLCGISHYTICDYTTLLPVPELAANLPPMPEVHAIHALLARYESHPENRRMLVWMAAPRGGLPPRLEGIEFAVAGDPHRPAELRGFRRIASCWPYLPLCNMARAYRLNSEDTVFGMMHQHQLFA